MTGAFDMYGSQAYPGGGADTIFDRPVSNSFMDPGALMLLGLGQGLLKAGAPSPFPQGLGGGLAQGMQGALSNAMMGQQMQQQNTLVGLEKAKQAMLEQQLKQAQAQFDMQQGILSRFGVTGGPPSAPSLSPPGMSPNTSIAAFGTPQFASSPSQAAGHPQGFPFDPTQMAAMRLAGMPDLIPAYNASRPDLSIQNGFILDKHAGIQGSVPNTNQQGFSTITMQDPNAPGGYRVQQVPGGNDAFTQQQLLSHAASSAYAPPITIPASSPTAQPTMSTPYRFAVGQGAPDVLRPGAAPAGPGPAGPGSGSGVGAPAGMSAQVAAEQAARATQQSEIAKNYGTIFNNLQNAAMSNPGKIAKTERIGTLLTDFEGGKFSKSAMGLAQAFNSAGFKVDSKLPNKEAAEALSGEIALDLRSTASGGGMPGAMSDADREFLKGMTPALGQTAEGRKTIIESKVKVMQRENKVADLARQYKKKYGQLDEDFFSQLSEWSARNPLFAK